MRFFAAHRRVKSGLHSRYSVSLEPCKDRWYWLPDEIERTSDYDYFEIVDTQGSWMAFARWGDGEIHIVNQVDRSHHIVSLIRLGYDGLLFMNVNGPSLSKMVTLSPRGRVAVTRTLTNKTTVYPLHDVQEDEVVDTATLKGDLFYIATSLAVRTLDVNTGQMGVFCDMVATRPGIPDINRFSRMLWYGGKLILVELTNGSKDVVLLYLDTAGKRWEEVSCHKLDKPTLIICTVSTLESKVIVNLTGNGRFCLAFDMEQHKWECVKDQHLFGLAV